MRILFFFGTRPEAIKLAPLINELRKYQDRFDVKVCVSAQHREMLDQVLGFFDIRPDFDLDIMRPNQNLFEISTKSLNGIRKIITACGPEWLIVQGDTTTTFMGSLAAFYEKIKIAHVEAGLRSFEKFSPFPEEINRVLTTHLADLHFAPTAGAKKNILRESIPEDSIHVVGNTSIDALFFCRKRLSAKTPAGLGFIDFRKKIILVTGHRRESFGKPFENICNALKTISGHNDLEIVYPVHFNPNVKRPVYRILKGIPNVHLITPLDYPSFVWLMDRSYVILTDSGGVQEEAPSLGKPVLVMRDVSERMEGIKAGTARLTGTDHDGIVHETFRLLTKKSAYRKMVTPVNPYGDGKSCKRIRRVFEAIQKSKRQKM
jgi:UDP-N-acetylglucosamine 2-epimerase (non-hydrolysing)